MDRNAFLASLSCAHPSCAVNLYIEKIEAMTAAQFDAHYAKLTAPNPERDAAIRKIAYKLVRLAR